MEYKIGDYIVCLNEAQINPENAEPRNPGGSGFEANYCKKIDKIYGNILWPFFGNGIFFNSVRLATQQETDYYNKIGKSYNVTKVNFDLTINNFEVW